MSIATQIAPAAGAFKMNAQMLAKSYDGLSAEEWQRRPNDTTTPPTASCGLPVISSGRVRGPSLLSVPPGPVRGSTYLPEVAPSPSTLHNTPRTMRFFLPGPMCPTPCTPPWRMPPTKCLRCPRRSPAPMAKSAALWDSFPSMRLTMSGRSPSCAVGSAAKESSANLQAPRRVPASLVTYRNRE